MAGLITYYLFCKGIREIKFLGISPVASIIIVKLFFEVIFKRLTNHRGIFHPISALLILTLLTLFIASNFKSLYLSEILLISSSTGLGFLSHLILDEIYSTVNLNGTLFDHPAYDPREPH